MNREEINTLKEVLAFLNSIPNHTHGDHYQLIPRFEDVINNYRDMVYVLDTLRTDAQMALDGTWDCSTVEGREGFESQIELINRVIKNNDDNWNQQECK